MTYGRYACRLLFSVLCLLSFLNRAVAEGTEYPPEVYKAAEFIQHITNDLGYHKVNIQSFSGGDVQQAITAIFRTEEELSIRAAEIRVDSWGAGIIFRSYISCVPTDKKSLYEKIIEVDGQRIRAHYACTTTGTPGQNQAVYVPSSEEGKAFVERAFRSQMYVFVKTDHIAIPFSTNGFADAWEKESAPAL